MKGRAIFLDRDGVINRRIPGDYVRDPSEFVFLEGVPEAIGLLNQHFDRVFVATNQQGIGKGRMTIADLESVHAYMVSLLESRGARLDKIYYCPDLAHQQPNCRKPHPAMALQAAKDFPEIDLQQSWMAGDSLSDLQFGWNAGMKTALIATNPEEIKKMDEHLQANALASPPVFPSLLAMVQTITAPV